MYSKTVLNRIVLLGPADPIRIIRKKSNTKFERAYGAYPFEQFVMETRKAYKEVFVISLSIFVDKTWTYVDGNLTVILVPQRKRARYYAIDMFRKEISQIQVELNKINPDLVHAHWSYEYGLAASVGKFPHLITIHDSPITILRYYKNLYRFIMVLISLRVRMNSKNYVFVTHYLLNKWKRYFLLRNNYPVINNFSNIDTNRKANERSNTVISIGDSSNRKNIKKLLYAWRTIELIKSDLVLVLVGPGLGEGDRLQRWEVSNLKLKNVKWAGSTSRDGVLDFLSDSRIMCHPSLEESQGLSLIEAMAIGVPTISGINSGGNVETVRESGYLVDVRNSSEIASALIDLLDDDQLRIQMSSKGIELYSQLYTPNPILEEYRSLYTKIISEWNQ